jgi:hypothetical protein
VAQNQTLTDTLGVGCDLYATTTEPRIADLDNLRNPQFSFYSVRAPLVHGCLTRRGLINGLVDRNTQAALSAGASRWSRTTAGAASTPTSVRMAGGIRINGGTSTGKSFRPLRHDINTPQQRQREGAARRARPSARGRPTCGLGHLHDSVGRRPRERRVQSRPGIERSNLHLSRRDLGAWQRVARHQHRRVRRPAPGGAVGCLYGVTNNNNVAINLLDASDCGASASRSSTSSSERTSASPTGG